MSGASIDRTIQNAMKTVGNVLGFPFEQFRPDNWVTPMSDSNLIASVTMSFSQDEAFSKNPEDTLQYFKLYLDYSNVQVGDIFGGAGRTFVVMRNTPLRGPVGVACDYMMSVERSTPTPLLDTKISLLEIASGVPCAMEVSGGVSNDGSMRAVPSVMGGANTAVTIWTYIPADLIATDDILTINSARYRVTNVNASANGVKIKAVSTKGGQ